MFRAYKRMEGRKDTSKEMKNKKMEYKKNTRLQKYLFLFHYKPTCEVGSV
jgi:hypothetical protein